MISGGKRARDDEVGDVLREKMVRVSQIAKPYPEVELRTVAGGQLISRCLHLGVGGVSLGRGLWHLAVGLVLVRAKRGVQWERSEASGVVDQEVLPT